MLRANEVKQLKNNLLNSFKRNDIGVDTFISLREKLNNEQQLCNLCIFDIGIEV